MEATDEHPVLNREAVHNLLNPPFPPLDGIIKTEEQFHPWRVRAGIPGHPQLRPPSMEVPFLRIWDHCSGSQPDENGCMMSRAMQQRLDTNESRIKSLTTHVNHGDWTTPTPFISFTTSPAAVNDLATMRERKGNRGAQTLTVVDPNVRLAAGLPVLDILAEMEHYGIGDPYDNKYQYYRDHYICLWQVSGREIVGHWDWDELAANGNWYEEIVMPAFREFRGMFMFLVPAVLL